MRARCILGQDEPRPAVGLGSKGGHPTGEGTGFVVEPYSVAVDRYGILGHGRRSQHGRGQIVHVDQMPADRLTHEMAVTTAVRRAVVRRLGLDGD